ncbi:unnamed protein product, partial [Gulo gulo]
GRPRGRGARGEWTPRAPERPPPGAVNRPRGGPLRCQPGGRGGPLGLLQREPNPKGGRRRVLEPWRGGACSARTVSPLLGEENAASEVLWSPRSAKDDPTGGLEGKRLWVLRGVRDMREASGELEKGIYPSNHNTVPALGERECKTSLLSPMTLGRPRADNQEPRLSLGHFLPHTICLPSVALPSDQILVGCTAISVSLMSPSPWISACGSFFVPLPLHNPCLTFSRECNPPQASRFLSMIRCKEAVKKVGICM